MSMDTNAVAILENDETIDSLPSPPSHPTHEGLLTPLCRLLSESKEAGMAFCTLQSPLSHEHEAIQHIHTTAHIYCRKTSL